MSAFLNVDLTVYDFCITAYEMIVLSPGSRACVPSPVAVGTVQHLFPHILQLLSVSPYEIIPARFKPPPSLPALP